MKKLLLISNLSLALLLSACASKTDTSSTQTCGAHCSHSLNESEKSLLQSAQIIDAMHMAMMQTPLVKSGSIEKDFLSNMIPHHEGAIESSKRILNFTQNEQIRQIANNIIAAQEKENAQFRTLLAGKSLRTTPLSKTAYEKFIVQEEQIMADMMRGMSEDIDLAGDLDQNFLKAMLAHHEGAIALSKQILGLSKDKTVRQIATKIIKDQERETKEFNALLKAK